MADDEAAKKKEKPMTFASKFFRLRVRWSNL